jgi:hypothetical protein
MRTALAVLLVLAGTPQTRPAPDAAERAETARLIARATAWTAAFEEGLSGLLFRERFLQKVDGQPPATKGTISRIRHQRELLLEANVFLLRPDLKGGFVLFRDVYSKNGEPVTDHTERLQTLLTDGSAKAVEQAQRLTDASALHNAGLVNRNVNIPTMALRFLEAGRTGASQFHQAGRETIARVDTVIVDFEEIGIPSLVRGLNDANVPARGRYWLEPATGAVVRAHVEFAGPELAGRLEIELARDETLASWVPRQMAETWRVPGQSITGLARYDRYQRLTVATGEIIK